MGETAAKTKRYWVVQGLYSLDYGWEDLCGSYDPAEAMADLRSYRLNEPQYRHRLINRSSHE